MGGGEVDKSYSLPTVQVLNSVDGSFVNSPIGRVIDPLPSLAEVKRLLSTKQSIPNIYAEQCKRIAESISQVLASRDQVMQQMRDLSETYSSNPAMREVYLNAIQTAENSYVPAIAQQQKVLAEFEQKYLDSLQELADCEVTLAFMENPEDKNKNTTLNVSDGKVKGTGKGIENANTTNLNKPDPDPRLQMLMPFWAVVHASDAIPYHFDRYHRAGQGFNFEGWDDEERAKLTSVIYQTHREAEEEIEKSCERHYDWDEQYPKLFIDFPAFLANTSGCGTAFGLGRANFIENIEKQIKSEEFRKCLRALGDPLFNNIKAIVITAKKGPLKGNKLIEAQYSDDEMIILWNDLDNISPISISFEEFQACKT